MNTIFHIVDRDAWRAAAEEGEYRHASLDDEGFVHFSFVHQVRATADRYYRHVPDLIVVEVDPARLPHEIKIENEFPHVYGPIPTSAAVRTYGVSEFSADGLASRDR
jgi:uncharacterized protein (DUF952 family)